MSIYKRINGKNRELQSLGRIKEYILDPMKTERSLCHSLGVDLENANEDMLLIKMLFGQTEGRQCIHSVLSFDRGVDTELASQVAKDVLYLYDGKYQAICAIHTNTKNVHAHYLINTVDIGTGKKFSESRSQMLAYRDKINDILVCAGLQEIGKIDEISVDSWEGFEFDDSESELWEEDYGDLDKELYSDADDLFEEGLNDDVFSGIQSSNTWYYEVVMDKTINEKTLIRGGFYDREEDVNVNSSLIRGVTYDRDDNEISKATPLYRGVTYDT